jgi:hypothetical protein
VLLLEEMRRTKSFYWAQQQAWAKREGVFRSMMASKNRKELTGGGIAYARKQIDVMGRMLRHCENMWKNVPTLVANSEQNLKNASEGWKQLPNWLQRHAQELEGEDSEYELEDREEDDE